MTKHGAEMLMVQQTTQQNHDQLYVQQEMCDKMKASSIQKTDYYLIQ